MGKIKKSEFRDAQVLNAIKFLKQCTILDIFEFCVITYPRFSWDYHNIRNSITRLYNDKIINCDTKSKKIDYNYNGKVYKQERLINYYKIGGNNEF